MWLNNFTSHGPPPDDGELVVFQEDFVSKEAYLKFLKSWAAQYRIHRPWVVASEMRLCLLMASLNFWTLFG